MRIKRLSLESWMKGLLGPVPEYYKPIEPVFQKDGWYYFARISRNNKPPFAPWQSWFEHNGKAYEDTSEGLARQFVYQLELENTPSLRAGEVDALEVLQMAGLASKGQIALLRKHKEKLDLRRLRTETLKGIARFRKRIAREFK